MRLLLGLVHDLLWKFAAQPGFTTLETKEAAWVDPEDSSKVYKIRTDKGVVKAPTFINASLS